MRKRKPVPLWQLRSAARIIIKERIKAAGHKVNAFEAQQILDAAIVMLATPEGKRMATRKARSLWYD